MMYCVTFNFTYLPVVITQKKRHAHFLLTVKSFFFFFSQQTNEKVNNCLGLAAFKLDSQTQIQAINLAGAKPCEKFTEVNEHGILNTSTQL